MKRTALFVLGLTAGGCSTLTEQPAPVECELDLDCPDGLACLNEVCVPSDQLPPLRHLGFDVREVFGSSVRYQVEVDGCDLELDRVDGSTPSEIPIPRALYSQTLRLEVFDQTPADFEMPTPDDLLPAEFRIQQVSRFGRERLEGVANHPTIDGETMVLLPTTLEWPRYHPADALPPGYGEVGFLLWIVTPQPPANVEPVIERAPMFQMLMPPRMGAPCVTDQDCCPEGQTCSDDVVANLCDDHPLVQACRSWARPEFRWRFIYETTCDRAVEGDVVAIRPDLQLGGPVTAAGVRLRYADPSEGERFGLHALDAPPIDERPPQCEDDDDCIAGEQFCNTDTHQCVLALAGRNAGRSVATDETGEFSTRVYTYCNPSSNVPLDRSFTITVTPPVQAMQPTVTFRTDARFNPPVDGQAPPTPIDRDLCIPDWGSPVPVELELTGSPVTLVSGTAGYTCCDISCLPATEEDAQTGPPSPPTTCTGGTGTDTPTLRVETDFVPSEEMKALWADATSPCVEPVVNANGLAGVFSRSASCSTSGICAFTDSEGNVTGLAAGESAEPRTYRLRIETPTGSLLGSRDTELAVGPDGPMTNGPIVLPTRRLVTGRVTLPPELCDASSEDCGAKNAVVYAERLRMPGETAANTPGPYFHSVTAFYDPEHRRAGAYVLPLDPGVWILTALPASAGLGGPARYFLVDLRDKASATQDFELDPGILVTVDLARPELGAFDTRSQVVPIDRGSWLAEGYTLDHPGRTDDPDPAARVVDLNRAGECLTAPDVTPDCKIRRLFAGSSLPLTQVGTVRFSTRSSPGGAVCL